MTPRPSRSREQSVSLMASTTTAPIIVLPIIAEPCCESWDQMTGGSRVRRCTQCDHVVHNLAVLSLEEIAQLFAQPGPLPCMRVTTREDGTLITTEPRVKLLRAHLLAATAISTAMAFGAASAQSVGKAGDLGRHSRQ